MRRALLLAAGVMAAASLLGAAAAGTPVGAGSIGELTAPATGTQTAQRGTMRRELPTPPAGKLPFPVDATTGCAVFWSSFGADRSGRSHEGTDIMGNAGRPVYAVVDGTLTQRYENTGTAGWGWTLVDSTTGITYKYFHLMESSAGFSRGDRVKVGDVIGFVGDSGTIAGNYHLHFEYRPSNIPQQPLAILDIPSICRIY